MLARDAMDGILVLRTRRRASGDEGSVMEVSEPRRWASSLGASGMAGTVLSPKTLWL